MIKKELPFNRPFPSPVEIKLKMAEGYGAAAGGALDGLFTHCAIVAENIFYSSLFPKKEPPKKVTVHLLRTIKRGESYRTTGYQCPKCVEEIKSSYHFCPACGIELEWVKTKKVAGRKIDELLLRAS